METNSDDWHEILKDLHQETIFGRRLDQFNRVFTLGLKALYEEEKNVRNNLKVLNRSKECFKVIRNYCFTVLSLFVALLTIVTIQLNIATLEIVVLVVICSIAICYFIPSICINRLEQKGMKVKQVFNRIKGYWVFMGIDMLTHSTIIANPDWKEIEEHVLFAAILLPASTVELINSLSTVVTPNQLEEWKRSVLSDPYTPEIILKKQDTIKNSYLYEDFKKLCNQYLAFIRENKI